MSLLGGLRVIDLSSGQAGGIATMVLADFGADVIKVERPGGDPTRREPAAPMWLRGKRSIVLDLDEAPARKRLADLAASADVVLASYRPGVAARLGAFDLKAQRVDQGLLVERRLGRYELAQRLPAQRLAVDGLAQPL